MSIVYISIAINILVAGFWGIILGFIPKVNFRVWPYGPDSSGNRILSSLYLTITIFSIYVLFRTDQFTQICIFLFTFQIIYKVLSALTVRDLKNPVVLSNLVIVLIHSFSLIWLLKHS